MEALQGWDAHEDSPTVVHLTTFLLALDEQYDRQALELRACLRRAEEAEVFNRMLQVQLAEAHASAAAAESREATMEESLKEVLTLFFCTCQNNRSGLIGKEKVTEYFDSR